MVRKKIEPIMGLREEEKLIVQKSLPLFSLWRSDLTLAEFKVLDTYLSRINSRDPERRQVIFEKGEIEKALGVKKINTPDLKERLKHLMGNVVEVPDKDAKKGFKLITLFEEAEAEQDDYGVWQVKMECTQKAMKYFFNIENLGYLRYKLRCITSIASRYSYIMFCYLEANRFRKSWEVSVEELKQILDCDQAETYKEFKEFNKLVLKRIHKEIHEKTECRYTYEPIKRGRRVATIQFCVQTIKDLEPVKFEEKDPDEPIYIEDRPEHHELYLWEQAVRGLDFSREQKEEINELLTIFKESVFPEVSDGDRTVKTYHYMALKVSEMKRRDKVTPIRNKHSYLLKVIKTDGGL